MVHIEFPVGAGLQQGSALSPCLLPFIVDCLSSDIVDGILWCMLSTDDYVLISEIRKQVMISWNFGKKQLRQIGKKLIDPTSKIEYVSTTLVCEYFMEVEMVKTESNLVPHFGAIAMVGPSMSYGAECWATEKRE